MKLFRLSLLALVACSDATPNEIEQLNLDRPVDVAFACHGGMRLTNGGPADAGQEILQTAQPIEACNIRSGPRVDMVVPQPAGQQDIGTSSVGSSFWYGFILQSGPGTVAVTRFPTKPSAEFGPGDVTVRDSDTLTPGKNSISVGEEPLAIATDKAGCYQVIANAGSCDLSTLEVNSAVAALTDGNVDPIVRRMDVKNAAGEVIRARPAAMVFEPPGGTIGNACPAQPTGLAYIAYPSCHLVAGVDVATGTIVTAIQFDAAGLPAIPTNVSNVSCPAECDGAAVTAGVRPVALDLELDPMTGRAVLAIGSDNSSVLTVYNLDTQTFFPASPIGIPLEDTTGRLGVTSVAVSPAIAMGGTNGMIEDVVSGTEHQFVYAVATDGAVRVADITGSPRECDTQIDPRYLREVRDVDRLACLPTNDPTLPRRAGARGPGIELIGSAIATSVDVSRVDLGEGFMPGAPEPYKMVGYFGLITAANGRVYVFNIDDDNFDDYVSTGSDKQALGTPIPLDIPHQLRDGSKERDRIAESDGKFVCNDPGPDPDVQGAASGGPRVAGNLQRTLPPGVIAAEKTGGLPSIRQVLCDEKRTEMGAELPDRPVNELFFSAPLDVRQEVFPDWRALRSDESWTITYEGSLSADKVDTAIDGPPVRTSQVLVDGSGMRIADATRPFCDAGVEPYDIVQLRGCDTSIGDAGCPIGYTCYVHPQSEIAGLGSCMLANEAERLADACSPFLRSQRRFTVARSKSGELQLLPRKVALRTTPLDGCTDDAQCEDLADYALQNASSSLPSDPALPEDPKTWRCQADNNRRPLPPTSTGKRCLLTCNIDDDCSFGSVCQLDPAATPQMGYCMEGVVPPQACVNAPQKYDLRAGEAFAVLGSRQGYIHPIIADAGDVCVRDPAANPLEIGRIPLDPPACASDVDPLTNRRSDGSYGPNPCKETVDETEYQLNYTPGTCDLVQGQDELLVTRPAAGLRFRNPGLNLTVVDPTYGGDLQCHGDRGGMLSNVPLVMPGFQIGFRVAGGFNPLAVPGIAPAFPTKVVRGPTQTFWIVDEGDFLSTSQAQPSTRGKVFRVDATRVNEIDLLE